MPADLALRYKSASQQARVVTESWGLDNLFCPNCPSPVLTSAHNNTQAFDYSCPRCSSSFQLKSKSSTIGDRILDSGFEAMMRAIREDRTPNLYALHYDKNSWQVKNLVLIPHFTFSASAIEARKPLGPTARRAGWVGCFIVLKNLPLGAKIHLISDGHPTPPEQVRESFRRISPLKEISIRERGWTLDVLRVVQSMGKTEFTNEDAYMYVSQLEKLHPNNRHVKDKIRQQLQILRDKGFIAQIRRGVWTLSIR